MTRESFVLDERNFILITMVNLRCIILSIVIFQMVSILGFILEIVPSLENSERPTFILRDVIILKKALRETYS